MMTTIYLRRGTAMATGVDHEWATYFQADENDASHRIELTRDELRGCLKFCPPSWELREEYHDRVEPMAVTL